VIVCPACRHGNAEDAVSCERCGASLEPGPTLMLARRAPTERTPIEIAQPKPSSPWRAVGLLGVLAGVAIGAAAWFALRPDPCSGTNFTSDQFGYCLTMPQNWEWAPAKFGDAVTVDQFSPPSESTTVLVEAADLPDDADLAAFAAAVRQRDQEADLTPGPIRETTVDGTEGLAWDIHYRSDSGRRYGVREVVVVNGHFGWRLMLSDTADAFEEHVSQFDGMVESFRFT
jgi:hypothetical protein